MGPKQVKKTKKNSEEHRPSKKVVTQGLLIAGASMLVILMLLIKLFPSLLTSIYELKEIISEEPVVEQSRLGRVKEGEDAKALLKISDFDWQNGEKEKAISMLKELITDTNITDPDGLAAWARLGMRYNSEKRYRDTINLYESLFQYIDPAEFKSSEAFVFLAHAYEAGGAYPDMLWALRTALKVATVNQKAISAELISKRRKAAFGIYEIVTEDLDDEEQFMVWHREKKQVSYVRPLPLLSGELVERVELVEQRINPIRFHFNEEGSAKLLAITEKFLGVRLAVMINGAVAMTPKIAAPYRDGVLTVPGPFTPDDAISIENIFSARPNPPASIKPFDLAFRFSKGDVLRYRSEAKLRLPNPLTNRYEDMKRVTTGRLECTGVSVDGIASIDYISESEDIDTIAESMSGEKPVSGAFSYRITTRGRRISDEFNDHLIISDIPYFAEYPMELDSYWQDKTIKWKTSPKKKDLFEGSVAYIPIASQRIAGFDCVNVKLFLKLEIPAAEEGGYSACGFGFKKGPVASASPRPITEEDQARYNLTVTEGALIREILFGSPVMNAGLNEGDVITVYDGKQVANMRELEEVVRSNRIVGKNVKLTVVRGSETLEMTLVSGPIASAYTSSKRIMSGFGSLIFAYDKGQLVSSALDVKQVSAMSLVRYRLGTFIVDTD